MTWLRKHFLFVAIVLVPSLASIVFYGLIASDVYISESRFVIRSPQRQLGSGVVDALLQGSAFTRSQDDTYSVHDYILSRDALAELDKQLGVRKAYSSDAIDLIDRFPGLDWDRSFEAFHRYWQKMVTVDFDSASSITVLRVRAFTAENAQRINETLLRLGERLVNDLNERSRQDIVRFAEQEVQLAEAKVRDASLALSSYRGKQAVYEPDRQASLQLQGVAKIQEELVSTEGQLAQLRKLSPRNPQVSALVSKAESLRSAIASESAKVTGGGGSYSARAPDFERLALEKGFADRLLASALTGLEAARSEAQRKQLYLERLVKPNLPDAAVEPRRLRSVATVILLSLIAWGVASLLIASIREHTD
jgi:capsular polysaccharide transport system permease protein